MDDGNFECVHCHESCVECPFETFENWQGIWDVRLATGEEFQITIDDDGAVYANEHEEGAGGQAARLVWSPFEHDGFLMRIHSVRNMEQGVSEHLRLEPDGSLTLRRQTPNGVVLGVGQPEFVDDDGADGDDGEESQTSAEGAGGGVAGSSSDLLTLLRAMLHVPPGTPPGAAAGGEAAQPLGFIQSLENVASGMRGLNEEERQRVRQQLRQDLRRITSSGIFQQALAAGRGAAGPAGGPSSVNFVPPGTENLTQALLQLLNQPVVFRQDSGPHNSVPQAQAARWLERKGVTPETADLETDWLCPICFDSTREGLVSLCQDAQERAVHLFHRDCVEAWVVRHNECPTCRRTPLVDTSPASPSVSV